ncbi:ABC transporter ATP-binding protein [Kaustia mangrovi]|uniref:ABC transporter ATP-binding protein n=1 Tax=Kaustia mangrovi TaxID=2593653 RepID=A0A7S8HD16_9HYPH|nr:ABC transporter ATP-binding protein [Kaustia mangrovi]QPC44221.1 ABC transporter ATP-binding protein [Kaustia mangrovi]
MTFAANDISMRFGGFLALDHVSIEMGESDLVGLIGPNGAGKSTLFAVASGFETASGGRVVFKGQDVTALSPAARARLGLGRTFQVPREFTHLSVLDNLVVAAPGQLGERLVNVFLRPGDIARQRAEIVEKAEGIADFLNLARVIDQPSGKLSGGQKKLLELGRVLMLDPALILLDEPFAGVNPVLVGEISERIGELNGRGVGFLVVEHNLQALSDLVRRMYVMDRGRIIAEGTPDEVLARDAVREAYMGGVV